MQLWREMVHAAWSRLLARIAGGLLLVTAGALLLGGLAMGFTIMEGRAAAAQLTAELTEFQAARLELEQFQALLSAVGTAEETRLLWSDRLLELIDALPATATVGTLEVNAEERTMSLTGTVDARSTVVALAEALRSFDWVESLEAPNENLLRPVKPQYTFTIHLHE